MNLETAASALNAYIDADIPAFLWGAVGVGKSSIVKQVAAERGWNVIDFRASTRDPVALMGLPDLSGKTTQWKAPDEFPQVERDGEAGILFLDELNAAAPSMQAAAFGLVLDRKVGEYTLPSGWRVLAAGNRQSDRAAAQRMPSALANRFAHIDVDPDLETTVRHFNNKGISPILTAFLRFRPSLLHNMGEGDIRAFPSPRSWEQAAKVVEMDTSLRMHLLSGIVGEGAAAELDGFIKVFRTLPSVKEVLSNPTGARVPDRPDGRFAISSAVARKVDAGSLEAACTYMKRLPREFSIQFMMDAVRRDANLCQTAAYIQWAVENRDVTIG